MEQQFAGWRKKYFTIWTGQGISTLTSSIVQMAIIWYITGRTKSAAVLSFATLAGFLPQAVLGMFIGVLIDRHDRKKIMICSDLVMTSACVALAVSGIWGDIPIWMIFIVLFIRSIGNAFYAPSLQAIMPSIIPKDQLTKYAGYSQSFESASMIASPAIAAVLYSVFPLKVILMLDVLGAIFAVATLTAVDIPAVSREDKDKTNLLGEVKEGYGVMRSVPGMRELLVIGALYAVIYFSIGTLYPLITMSYFNGGVRESGLVETVFAVGTLVGSVSLGIWGGRIDKIKAIAGSIGIYGAGTLVTGLLPPNGFYVPFYFGVQTSIYQIKIQGEYLGRALSLSSSISMVAMPLGLVLSGALAGPLGIENWFLISGGAALVIAVLALTLPALRHCMDG